MKNVLRLCCFSVLLSMAALSVQAATFYRQPDGEIIMEVSTPEEATRLLTLFGGKKTNTLPEEEGGQPLVPLTFSEQDFNLAQAKLIAYVRDINWKTGFNLTLRDAGFFRRLKIIFSGVMEYTRPYRMSVSAVYPDLENQLADMEDELITVLQDYATATAFDRAIELSLIGLRYAILTDKPFLLLFVDEGQYKELIDLDNRLHPNEPSAIESLMNNLYKFFAYRAVYMENGYEQHGYDANTEQLIKIAKMGEGDATHTWEKLAAFAEKMYVYEAKGDLDPGKEHDIHLPRLEYAMRRVKHNLDVEKKAADIAYKDPAYQDIVIEAKEEGPKNPTLEQEALKWLQEHTRDEIKEAILKHKMK